MCCIIDGGYPQLFTTASNFSIYVGIMYVMLHRHIKWDFSVCVVVTL